MRHRWSITDKCPLPAEFSEVRGVTYLKVGSNAFSLEEASMHGWIEETKGVRVDLPALEWDLNIKIFNVPSFGATMRVDMEILKGSERVLKLKGLRKDQIESNPKLLRQMFDVLNGILEDSSG